MLSALPKIATMVPVIIQLLARFVVGVSGATIALLVWRARQGKFDFPHP